MNVIRLMTTIGFVILTIGLLGVVLVNEGESKTIACVGCCIVASLSFINASIWGSKNNP